MNCDKFQEIIGMRCNALGEAVEVITPFTFADGNAFEVFAQSRGDVVHFFDDGFTLLHLHSAGIDLGADKKRWKPLKKIAEDHGVTLSDKGVFEVFSPLPSASQGFAQFISTLLSVATWEKEQASINTYAEFLIEEAALYLQAWKPNVPFIKRPAPLIGLSGRKLKFDFQLGNQYIDAVSAHSNSTGSELRKILDFHAGPGNKDKEVLVIVDDRVNPEIAKEEISVISQIANTWAFSALIRASGMNPQSLPS